MSDDTKPKSGSRAPLSLKRTVEIGQVKQSFSHGRTRSVVVETKKTRLGQRGDKANVATQQGTPDEQAAPAAPPPAATNKPATPPRAKSAPAPARRSSASNDLLSRQERQTQLLQQAEEERLKLAEAAQRRDEEARQEMAARAAEEQKQQRAKEAQESTITQSPQTPEALESPESILQDPPAARAKTKAPDDEADSEGKRRGGQRSGARRHEDAPSKSPRGRDSRDRRQSGKLTVARALSDDEGVRARSLAALKRAREKEKERRFQGAATAQAKQVRDVVVPEAITVQELANRMAERAADVIKTLLGMGVMATINHTLDQDTAELLVGEFGHRVKRVSESDVEIGVGDEQDDPKDLKPRAPVVTIMGHVDHGKTSLLDALRGSDIAAHESGGITQHIGAYQVTTKSGDHITLLDTPGHEAFTEMRARGANVTDIVILVVAADDGLQPQTIEAINHTKAANAPMIVAINKMDRPGADANRVRQALLQHNVQLESMGGDVQDVEISALKKTGLDELTEKILLQAELMELKANPDRPAEGNVIEARLDKGRGAVATVLVRRGTLHVGDIFVVGAESGKVRALVDDKGQQTKSAGPSTPVEVLGLTGAPMAGDPLSVVENEARAREIAAYRRLLVQRKRTTQAPSSLEAMFSALKTNKMVEYPVVIKADVHGSVEAIAASLNKLSTDEIRVHILHSGVGAISESDVALAKASNAPIICFGVRANSKAREAAARDNVELRFYDVIYTLIDEIRDAMVGKLAPLRIEHVVGRANVLEVFPAGKGKAAGLRVFEGVIRRNLKARVMRDDTIIWTGNIASIRRFKDDVNEVRTGLECGVVLESNRDVQPGDVIETFEVEEKARTL